MFMILSPLPSTLGSWSDTDSDGNNDTWTDPNTSQVTTLADLNNQSTDADNDGATNDEEAAEGSDPFSYDTDYDGISDGDELHIVKPLIGTSLTDWDSDGDYVSDYDEWHNFNGVTYTDGQLPSYPGASFSDYDGDGFKNPFDPFPTDPDNYSSINNTAWYGEVLADADGDSILNWEDSEPNTPAVTDSDGDGIEDGQDPFPYDSSNYSSTNGITWYGDVLGDSDADGTLNWEDTEPYGPASSDSDGDGIDDATDPFPGDSANYSALNSTYWYGDVFGDADSDGSLNWEDSDPYGSPSTDSDGDGIDDTTDPFPGDSSNYSPSNGVTWYGDVFGDADSDGTLNWEDSDPYGSSPTDSDGDGFFDSEDPFPNDSSNYSATNTITWYGELFGDADSDGIVNWSDPEPYGSAYDDSDYDGVMNGEDPFPNDATNYSSINNTAWYEFLFYDDDLDSVVNWQDAWPSDPYDGNPPPDPDNDGDGLTESEENNWGTSDWDVDCDDDGLTDYEELIVYQTDPFNAYSISIGLGWNNLYTDYQLVDLTDSDGDGIPNRIEEFYGMLPNDPADGDGDLDGNGMTNLTQYNAGLALNADLNLYDTDQDGMSDIFETYYGLNKYSFSDAATDGDGDGVLNIEEMQLLLSPISQDTVGVGGLGDLAILMEAMLYPEGEAPTVDSDSDGIADWMENALEGESPRFTRVAVGDLDGDGMPDTWEHQYGRWKYPSLGLYLRHNDADSDADGDTATNIQEFGMETNPLITDTNQNGINDSEEDTDGDGLTDLGELALGTNPLAADTDGDGFDDQEEYLTGGDALDGQSTPLYPSPDPELSEDPLPPQPRPILPTPVRDTWQGPSSTASYLREPAEITMEAAYASGSFAETLEIEYDEWYNEVSRSWTGGGNITPYPNGESEDFDSFGAWSGGFGGHTTEAKMVPFAGEPWIEIGPSEYYELGELVDENGEDTLWYKGWAAEEARFRVKWAQQEDPALAGDAWWLIHRWQAHWGDDPTYPEVESMYVSVEPYIISNGSASMTLETRHWAGGESFEKVTAQMIRPEVLMVNDGDADSDGLPNFADGMVNAIAPPEEQIQLGEDEHTLDGEFTALNFHTDSLRGAKFRLSYSASPPQGVVAYTSPEGETRFLPAPGALRVWKSPTNANARDPRAVMEGGSYIPPNVWLSAVDIHGTDQGNYGFHVESVRLSEQAYDHQILIEVDQDGDGPSPPYVLTKKFYTSVSATLHTVTEAGIGERTDQLLPSLPNPTIEIDDFQVTNARVAEDGSLLADITVSGTVHSTVCDMTEGTATGAIKSAFASVNGKVHGQSVASLSVEKSSAPVGPARPYAYAGHLQHTMTGVPVTEGWNRLVVGVQDPIYHLSGTASVGFEILATPPPSYASETAVAVQLPATGGALQENQARVTVMDAGVTVLDDVLLERVDSPAAVASYHSVAGAEPRVVLYFPERPALDGTVQESAAASLVVRDAGGGIIYQGGYGSLAESAADTSLFFWSATGTFAPYLGWSVAVGEVGEPEATGPGEFHPVTLRLDGPAEIVAKVAQVHFVGQALPVVAREAEYYAADPQHPERPAVFMSLPIPAVEVPTVEPDQPESGEEDPDWELKEDVPDEHMEAVKNELTVGRNLFSQIDADALIERVTRLAATHLNDQTEWAYYDGFIDGFINNPVSTVEDAWNSICGLTSKAINVATLVSPPRIIWEMTGGDRYEGEIAAAKKAVRGAIVAVDLVKEFAPEAILFLAKLSAQNTQALLEWHTTGIIPGTQKMGKEQQIAFEVMAMLLVMADDAWAGMDTYQRGYWQGYLAFEVMAVVISTVLTAEAGGVGGLAVLARHGPKLVKILTFLEKVLVKLDEVPQLARLLAKVREIITGSSKLPGAFCFVKGTPVLTSKGMKPIEQVQAMDWVWSRSEDGEEWGWRPVLGTVVTHPDALAHLSYRALGGANGVRGPPEGGGIHALPAGMLAGLPESGEISGSLEHPFYVQRKAEGFAGFVPLREMRVGDVLTLADGREAEVTHHRVEQAAPGTLFTTYNFEVAEYHTYFAGVLPVWVHNMGLTSCNWLEKQINEILSKRGLTWETSSGQRADILAQELGDIIEQMRNRTNPTTGEVKAVPARLIRLAMAKICQADYKDYGVPGGHNNLGAFKTVEWWNNLWLKTGLGKGSPVKFQWQIHHLVEDFMLKRLDLSPGPKRMDVPGVALKAKSSGQPGQGPFHKGEEGLASVIYSRIYAPNLRGREMLEELKDIYSGTDSPFTSLNLWPAARDWLITELTPSGRAHLVPP